LRPVFSPSGNDGFRRDPVQKDEAGIPAVGQRQFMQKRLRAGFGHERVTIHTDHPDMEIPNLGRKPADQILIGNHAIEIDRQTGDAQGLIHTRDARMQVGEQLVIAHASHLQHAA
jgi:hypothetical protein